MRLDRAGSFTIPIWAGLFLSGLYILWAPRIDPLLSGVGENLLGLVLSIGAGICLAGTVIGQKVKAYTLQIVGMLVYCGVLAFVATRVDRSVFEQFTLYGSLGAIVQIGSIRLMFKLGREIYAEREEGKVKHDGVQED